MIHQKSFGAEVPMLYIVATPIGNREEMSPRAIATLREVDVIACEDTRSSAPLLQHFGIETRRISYHKHNEKSSAEGIIQLLDQGLTVALISDAGYPLISDPGTVLVQRVVAAGYSVVPISGSSAFINALVASGLDTARFTFQGFLEHKDAGMRTQLETLKAYPETLIFYVSVHRVEKSLVLVKEVLGNRRICLARELTKLHETFLRGTITEVLEALDVVKGEFVLVVEGAEEKVTEVQDIISAVDVLIEEGHTASRAIAQVAKTYKVSKNQLYQEYLAKKSG